MSVVRSRAHPISLSLSLLPQPKQGRKINLTICYKIVQSFRVTYMFSETAYAIFLPSHKPDPLAVLFLDNQLYMNNSADSEMSNSTNFTLEY